MSTLNSSNENLINNTPPPLNINGKFGLYINGQSYHSTKLEEFFELYQIININFDIYIVPIFQYINSYNLYS